MAATRYSSVISWNQACSAARGLSSSNSSSHSKPRHLQLGAVLELLDEHVAAVVQAVRRREDEHLRALVLVALLKQALLDQERHGWALGLGVETAPRPGIW